MPGLPDLTGRRRRIDERLPALFEGIEGDQFTVLGMPLLPLLGALREEGMLLP